MAEYEDMQEEIEVLTNLAVTRIIEWDDLNEFSHKVALLDVRKAMNADLKPYFGSLEQAKLMNMVIGTDAKITEYISEEGDDTVYALIYWGTYSATMNNIVQRALAKCYNPNPYRKVQ